MNGNEQANNLYGDEEEMKKDDINKHQKNELSEKGSNDWLNRKNPETGKTPKEELEELKNEIEDEEEDDDES